MVVITYSSVEFTKVRGTDVSNQALITGVGTVESVTIDKIESDASGKVKYNIIVLHTAGANDLEVSAETKTITKGTAVNDAALFTTAGATQGAKAVVRERSDIATVYDIIVVHLAA